MATRTHGTLTRWNDDRGFGFITPALGNAQIFVHVSAFPRDGVRPRVGELVSFELSTGADGKQSAARIMRAGSAPVRRRPLQHRAAPPQRGWVATVVVLLLIGGMGAFGYDQLAHHATSPHSGAVSADAPAQARRLISTDAASTPLRRAAAAPVSDTGFTCDGRNRCSQMRSCAEARQFLQQCPSMQMDGDGDGEPCEQQWCN